MKITADFTRLHTGESGGCLSFTLSPKNRDKKVKLGFLTPLGKTYFTDFLPYENGEGSFVLNDTLTDGRGLLLCQLFLTDDKGESLLKSPVESFHVYSSVSDNNEETCDSELKSRASGLWEGENVNADYTGLYTASIG